MKGEAWASPFLDLTGSPGGFREKGIGAILGEKIVRAGIVGASGYAGGELLRILSAHPGVEVIRLAGETKAGSRIGDIFPHLDSSAILEKISDRPVWEDVDVVFFALPAGQSFDLARSYVGRGIPVIDLGPDYRLTSPEIYRHWYRTDHDYPEALDFSVYGLVEWTRDSLPGARMVACPGCFPTGALMGLLPFHAEGWIDPEAIIVDGKSGITGAGRSLSLQTHFPEIAEGLVAYRCSIIDMSRKWSRLSPAGAVPA